MLSLSSSSPCSMAVKDDDEEEEQHDFGEGMKVEGPIGMSMDSDLGAQDLPTIGLRLFVGSTGTEVDRGVGHDAVDRLRLASILRCLAKNRFLRIRNALELRFFRGGAIVRALFFIAHFPRSRNVPPF